MTPQERRELEMAAGRRTVAAAEARMSPEDLAASETTAGRMHRLYSLHAWEKEKKCFIRGLYYLIDPGQPGVGNSNIEILRHMNDAENIRVTCGNQTWSDAGHVFPSPILFANVALAIGAGQHLLPKFTEGQRGGFGG